MPTVAAVRRPRLRGVVDALARSTAETPTSRDQGHPPDGSRSRSRRRISRTSGAGAAADARSRPRRQRLAARRVVAVVAQEELLERRRVADQRADAEPAQQCRAASPRWSVSTSKRDPAVLDSTASCTPGSASRPVARAARSRPRSTVRVRWRSSASVPRLDGAAGADDAHPVAQRLDLGEDVAGQQHRAALGRGSSRMQLLEHRLHQRVEARTSARRGRSSSTSEASAATRATFCRLPLE